PDARGHRPGGPDTPRRRGAVALLLVAVSAALVAYDLSRGGEGQAASADGAQAEHGAQVESGAQVDTAAESASGAAAGLSPSADGAAATPSVAATGPGTFTYAAGTGPVLGTGGALRPFRVAVGIGRAAGRGWGYRLGGAAVLVMSAQSARF